ncbi:UvrD-helicase domain-containing protein [Thermodesulfobacteriota bacterium]
MKSFKSIHTKIAGVTYDNRQQVCKRLFNDAKLVLEREPTNAYDTNAVAVLFEGQQCGYIPREIAATLTEYFKAGVLLEAVVTWLANDGLNISVDIMIQEKPEPDISKNKLKENTAYYDWISNEEKNEIADNKSSMPLEFTDEQKEIISLDLNGNTILNVIAFAGTGKTTTLLEYSKSRPDKRFLYIAFNRSVRKEAQAKFTPNVTCHTSHSLAWQKYKNTYNNKLVNNLRLNKIKSVLGLNDYLESRRTNETLANFLVSSDIKFSKKHLPRLSINETKETIFYIEMAAKLWVMMCDPNNMDIGMLHDGYLKLYQISEPQLDYDYLLLDEAQDTNPAVADIILRQHFPKILVGDPHQQIYAFRGAQDAMTRIEADKTLYLTYSFRFGEEIAWVANKILKTFKGELKSLKGYRNSNCFEELGECAVIARTNATVFDKAVTLSEKYKVGFLGGIDGYRFREIIDIYKLYSNFKSEIRDPFIQKFSSYKDIKVYADEVEDWEIRSICKVIDKYGHNIPKLVEKIENAAVDKSQADFVLTTAHKAKGSQFSKIKICDDFPTFFSEEGSIGPESMSPDEANLIYVTVTRAKHFIEFSNFNDWERFISYDKSPRYERILEFFGQTEKRDSPAGFKSQIETCHLEETGHSTSEHLQNVDRLCHKYHPGFIEFWASKVVQNSISIERLRLNRFVIADEKKYEYIVPEINAVDFLRRNCAYGVTFNEGRMYVEIDMTSAVATCSFDLLLKLFEGLSVWGKGLSEDGNKTLHNIYNMRSGMKVNEDNINSIPEGYHIYRLLRYNDIEFMKEYLEDKEVENWVSLFGDYPLDYATFDFSIRAMIAQFILGDRDLAEKMLCWANETRQYFDYFEGMFRILDDRKEFLQWFSSWLYGENTGLPDRCLEAYIAAANAVRMLFFDENEIPEKILNYVETAYKDEDNSITMREREYEFGNWIYCAESWLLLFDNKDKAATCLEQAEGLAKTSWNWTSCSLSWRNLFGDCERAEKCDKQANTLQ